MYRHCHANLGTWLPQKEGNLLLFFIYSSSSQCKEARSLDSLSTNKDAGSVLGKHNFQLLLF